MGRVQNWQSFSSFIKGLIKQKLDHYILQDSDLNTFTVSGNSISVKPVLPASKVSARHLPHLLSTLTAGLHEVMNKLFTIHLLFEDWLHQSMGLLRTQNSNQTFCSEELGLPIKCPPSCFAVTKSIQVSSCCHLAELMLLLSAKETSVASEQRQCQPSQPISSNSILLNDRNVRLFFT